MQRLSNFIMLNILPLITSLFLRLLAVTLSIRIITTKFVDELQRKGENAIFAFWHGRLLLMPFAYKSHKGAYIMISRHRDGEFVSRAVKYLGISSVRGSTTRGGISAFKKLIDLTADGYDIAFTPDGPKGPKYKAQMGIIELAKLTGKPIIPLTYSASKKKS
ncbi:MAG: lysophospholipid acyltransferase family protein [Nitrospirae bacterium]|nr:lysophospholipid acyltransferase family protein [Nitrospirota bacterium]